MKKQKRDYKIKITIYDLHKKLSIKEASGYISSVIKAIKTIPKEDIGERINFKLMK
jgi:hypothetical protein